MKPNKDLAAKYPWAVNQAKLIKAVDVLNELKKINPAIKITEEIVKEEYVKRAGLLSNDKPEPRPLGKKIAPTYGDSIMDDKNTETVHIEGMEKPSKNK